MDSVMIAKTAGLVILFVVWIYFLTVFKRKKLEFFYFILGSVGMFMFAFIVFRNIMTDVLTTLTCYLTGVIGNALGFFKAYTAHAILFIENMDGPISLYVDFECGGVIEILVFISLISFFSVYKLREKILLQRV